MALISRISMSIIKPRDTDAVDNPLATREVNYTDSSGNQSGKVGYEVRLYNAVGAPLVKNAVYQVNYTGNPATSPEVIACTTTTPPVELVVAKEAVPAASWGWFCYAGWTDALVNGTTDVAQGDFLKLTSGTSAVSFIKDGSGYTTSSHAIAGAASTANSDNTTLVEMIGGEHLVA